MRIENNINDVALIFEGGGMRGSFSAGVANVLLENEIYFNYVAGISAGTSVLLNYLSRDIERGRKSFIDIVDDPNFGGWTSFIKGKGFFNAEYIYENMSYPGQSLEYKFDVLMTNPAKFRIGSYDVLADRIRYFTNEDVEVLEDILKIARSSSSLPILMPPATFKDGVYYDGGICGGIALDAAIKDGYKKFFIVRTRNRGYIKSDLKHKKAIRRYFRNTPMVAEKMISRAYVYNCVSDMIDKLEEAGKAIVVYPDDMKITSRERDKEKLTDMYNQGYRVAQRNMDEWKKFLYNTL